MFDELSFEINDKGVPYWVAPVYDYKIGGINQCKKLYHYLYDGATIFLGRKNNVFEEFYK